MAIYQDYSSSSVLSSWKNNFLHTEGNFYVYSNQLYICILTHTSGSEFESLYFESALMLLKSDVNIMAVDDFITTAAYGTLGWNTNILGTGSLVSNSTITEIGHYGIIKLTTGILGLNRYATLHLAADSPNIFLGNGETRLSALIKTGAAFPTDVKFYFGLISGTTNTEENNKVTIFYNQTTSSGFWQYGCRANGTSTTAISTTSIAINTWYKIEFIVNNDASSVKFYINDILIGTTTTNIPTGTSRGVSPGFKLVNTSLITTADWYIDYFKMSSSIVSGR